MRDTDFWRVPGSLTDLASHSAWVNDLPDDPAAVREVVASLLIHRDHPALAESGPTDSGLVENQLRRAADIVAAIRARVPYPTEAKDRSPTNRVAGVCRHFAVVLVAVLRAKGVPARARNGVASYFRTGKWDNHWIVEWWNTDGHCWVRADAQLDENHRAALPTDVDPDHLPPGAFLNAGETWLGVRSGSIDPENCGGPDSWGMDIIRANVVRDLAALNKVELLAWDVWGIPTQLYLERITLADADRRTEIVAQAIAEPADVARLQQLYDDDCFRVPAVIASIPDSEVIMVELDL